MGLALVITALFVLLTATLVVFGKNPIYSAFSLILSFFGLAVLYALMGNYLLGAVQVLVYTGAIVVLFVFVVMLIQIHKGTGFQSKRPFLSLFSILVSWNIGILLFKVSGSVPWVTPESMPGTEMRAVSKLLFTDYLWPFELLSLFLLVMIIGVYLLARPEKGNA